MEAATLKNENELCTCRCVRFWLPDVRAAPASPSAVLPPRDAQGGWCQHKRCSELRLPMLLLRTTKQVMFSGAQTEAKRL